MANIKILTDNDGQVLPITRDSAVLDENGVGINNIYQRLLVSGTNIKTINNTSILGSGNMSIANTTYGTFTTAANGLVPKPTSGTATTNYVLTGNGTWATMSGGASQAEGMYPGGGGVLGSVIPTTENEYGFPTLTSPEYDGSVAITYATFPTGDTLYAMPVEISKDGVIYVPITTKFKNYLVGECDFTPTPL